MDMRAMERISDMLCREIDEIAKKGDMSMGDLEIAYKAIGTLKNIGKIKAMDGGDSYSMYGNGNRSHGNSYGNSYGDSYDGNSYRSRHYVRGHYSRDGYSRSEGIDYLRQQMEEMVRNGDVSGEDRMCIEKAMNMLQ